jgi:hypothetical protein
MLPTFLTVEEADAILCANAPWSTAAEDNKQNALEMARIYTETNYTLRFNTANEAPEKVKIGNAIIANENLISDIFSRQDGLGTLTEKTVKASSVTTTKKYNNQASSNWRDPFQKATAIMQPFCVLISGSGIVYKTVIR